MARIVDWHVPPIEIKLIGAMLGYSLLMAIMYLLGPIWREYSAYLVLTSTLMLVAGLLTALGAPRKARFRWVIYVGAAVGLLGGGFMFGSMAYLSGSVLIGLALLVAMTAFFILVLSVSVWVNRTQERVKVFVDGDYSLDLLREMAGRIEGSLLRNGLSYEKHGNNFQLELEKKERIIVALTAEEVFEDTKYLLILRTNRSRDSSVYTSLKAEISRIVHDIEREKGIDSYPKVKRVVCRKCRRDVSYVIATDQFYCSKCRKYEKEKDVYVVGSEP
ncbi:MAG: hypothetical protein LN416_07060 [Candidatus Thermoplasmatota archaeon]|nr:hypothetical protein [Candidatus Thermoplasmatota archaeon]